eukprot:Hpha_TRINITY_DN23885_c0_g1::TRINITY_DN23885_c0_g1_i1::g.109843::m.109843/K00864/glpK, GK; glycerol kinase
MAGASYVASRGVYELKPVEGKSYVAAIDQGTTSSRVIIYDQDLHTVASHRLPHEQITPQPGWLQHNPVEILKNVETCMNEAVQRLRAVDPSGKVVAVGITNQRETVVVWDKDTGSPLHDAVVWCDLRTQGVVDQILAQNGGNKDCFRDRTGLPASPYFSAYKLRWLIDNVPEVRQGFENGSAIAGTIDTWLAWNLSGRSCHAISVCNAARTNLMNLKAGKWDPDLCRMFGVPMAALPNIVSNAEHLATMERTRAQGASLCALIGDQHGALVGQMCFRPGDVKNTYGTGCFLIMNTGTNVRASTHGLLSTVAYKIGNGPIHYALEGSVVQGGALISWLKDSMGIIKSPQETDQHAEKVENTGGVVIVPAFAGLFAPHWRMDARGVICGLTMHTKVAHICRAALTAIAMQSVEVLHAMEKDSMLRIRNLRVDGGATNSNLLMQLQADLADVAVKKPMNIETTALGAAMCAAVGAGLYSSLEEAEAAHHKARGPDTEYHTKMSDRERREQTELWNKALDRSKGWVESKI